MKSKAEASSSVVGILDDVLYASSVQLKASRIRT